ncbi:MAG: hypothetical protein ACUVR8_04305 [Acidobacteriota bacterium]
MTVVLTLGLTGQGAVAHPVTQEPTTGVAPKPKAQWKAQEEFHSVLAGTFHPMEDGDFGPVRKRAAEMARKARLWARSRPPKGYDAAKLRPMLANLERGAAEVARLVAQQASDDDIKQALNKLHDQYHEIAGECR